MNKFIDFEFKFRPLRAIFVIVVAALVYWVSDSLLAGLIALLPVIDIQDELGKDDQ